MTLWRNQGHYRLLLYSNRKGSGKETGGGSWIVEHDKERSHLMCNQHGTRFRWINIYVQTRYTWLNFRKMFFKSLFLGWRSFVAKTFNNLLCSSTFQLRADFISESNRGNWQIRVRLASCASHFFHRHFDHKVTSKKACFWKMAQNCHSRFHHNQDCHSDKSIVNYIVLKIKVKLYLLLLYFPL